MPEPGCSFYVLLQNDLTGGDEVFCTAGKGHDGPHVLPAGAWVRWEGKRLLGWDKTQQRYEMRQPW